MKRRDFLKIIGLGSVAASATYYFDVGANLYRQKPLILLPGTIVWADTGEPLDSNSERIFGQIGIIENDGRTIYVPDINEPVLV